MCNTIAEKVTREFLYISDVNFPRIYCAAIGFFSPQSQFASGLLIEFLVLGVSGLFSVGNSLFTTSRSGSCVRSKLFDIRMVSFLFTRSSTDVSLTSNLFAGLMSVNDL